MFEGAARLFHDGGPIMYPLLLCSFVGLTVVIERSIHQVLRNRKTDRKRLLEVLELIRLEKWEEAGAKAAESEDDLLTAVSHGLEGGGDIRGVFEMLYAEKERGLNRYMMVLDTIITLAPLLGILGTVLGIIESFDLLGAKGARDPMAVTGGIAKALITTATGLGIAILMLIPFNFFRSTNETALNEIEEVATYMETYSTKRKGTNAKAQP